MVTLTNPIAELNVQECPNGFSIASDNAAAARVTLTCECWPCTIVDQAHRDELRANAHLIAAAPDLAEACAALVAAYDAASDSGSVEWEDLDEAHRLATEALKKAGLEP